MINENCQVAGFGMRDFTTLKGMRDTGFGMRDWLMLC